jgi:amino acid adenylation domain-containing protein
VKDLADILPAGVLRNAGGIAIVEPGGEITYRELDELVDRLARGLVALGVSAGDRVAIWLPKSINAVAAMQAALRVGASYIPVDPLSPCARVRKLLLDADVAACVTLPLWAEEGLTGTLAGLPTMLADEAGRPGAWLGLTESEAVPDRPADPDRLAYILYTSGSTGTPKGVCISHRNALAFVEWASSEIGAGPDDRFSSHAPFHFDLSVLDLYVAMLSGATVCLIPETLSFLGTQLVDFVERERISVWYSVPSALVLMMEQGGFPRPGAHAPGTILFAGEPFPMKHARRLREALPDARLLNLYGPTETNVCTYHEVITIPDDATSLPIGSACSGDRVWAERVDGSEAPVGQRGELIAEGPTVMLGYWGAPPHRGPYRTGDVVERVESNVYSYVGRRDSMVKVRGHRVELGEVESALLAHENVSEAAALVVGSGLKARLIGVVSSSDGGELGLLDMKRHCAELLPRYMIVHHICTVDELPRTRNGKLDRSALVARCQEVYTT